MWNWKKGLFYVQAGTCIALKTQIWNWNEDKTRKQKGLTTALQPLNEALARQYQAGKDAVR
jgi:hypothetical protein